MLLLLPREAAKPQASFLLRDSFGLKQLDASIVLTNFISAYEYRFEDILKQVNLDQEEREDITRGGNVICQAFADKDNPLSWAVLAHEYGHAINDRNALSEKILTEALHRPKHDDNPKIELKMALNASVVAETVADFIAAHVLGPASLMPILFVEMMQPRLKKIERISAGHPPTPLRVQMVSEYLKSLKVSTADFDVVFETYAFDYSRKLSEMDSDDRDTVEAMGKEAENLLSPLCKVISSKVGELNLRRFEERNLETARALAKKLAERLPISSIRKRSDESIFAGLNSLRTGYSTPDQVYEVVSGLDEEPVAASEILTAGWLYKLSTFEYELKKSFGSGNGQIPGIGIYTEYVEKTERLLLKSLELVEVHSALLHVSTVA
jgi:hypothetical protein